MVLGGLGLAELLGIGRAKNEKTLVANATRVLITGLINFLRGFFEVNSSWLFSAFDGIEHQEPTGFFYGCFSAEDAG